MLLVEDNETDIFVIRKALSRCALKFRLDVARSGAEALAYLGEISREGKPCPALLLLDLNLPAVPGIEVLREVRTSPCNRTAVVVVTSSESDSDRVAVKALGADAYFRKPSDLGAYMELAQVVIKVLPGAAPAE